MLALLGTIQGNTIVVENDSITNYDGKEVILTILERGKHVDEYMEEIRNNDRI